jgi:hypothetical protein
MRKATPKMKRDFEKVCAEISEAHPVFFRAIMEGPTFTFEAFAKTRSGAMTEMLVALNKHGKQYGVPDMVARFEDQINIREVIMGFAYRDGEKL